MPSPVPSEVWTGGEDLVHLDGPVGSGSCVCYFCSRESFLFSSCYSLFSSMGWDISIDQRNKSEAIQKYFQCYILLSC